MDEFKEVVDQFRKRYEQEYDFFVSTGIKINDNLLLVNSAIIAVLVASSKTSDFKYPILFFFCSIACSLLSLFLQKELSRESAIKFLTVEVKAEESREMSNPLNAIDFPETNDLRKKSDNISKLITLSLLSFFVATALILIRVFCLSATT